jgi:hypothetical protein
MALGGSQSIYLRFEAQEGIWHVRGANPDLSVVQPLFLSIYRLSEAAVSEVREGRRTLYVFCDDAVSIG